MNTNAIMDGEFDEISLGDSFCKEDADVEPKQRNCKYSQVNSIKGLTRSFELFDYVHLYCQTQSSFSKKSPKHRIDLTFLDQKPSMSFILAWKSLVMGILFLLLALMTLTTEGFSELFPGPEYALLATALSVITGFILIFLSYYKSRFSLVFKTFTGQIPVVFVSYKLGNKNFKKFITLIQKSIKFAQNRDGITMKDRLVGEMKDMRRLKDIGIISEKNYNQAQAKILKHKSYTG